MRVQLDEEPAWLRRGGGVALVQLLTERDQEDKRGSIPIDQEALRDDLEKLKVERGEQGRMMPQGIVTDTVVERIASASTPAAAPKQDVELAGTVGSIEGYAPRGVKIGSRAKIAEDLGDVELDLL